jgi:hypothetical protein
MAMPSKVSGYMVLGGREVYGDGDWFVEGVCFDFKNFSR